MLIEYPLCIYFLFRNNCFGLSVEDSLFIEMIGLEQKRPILCVSLLFFNQELISLTLLWDEFFINKEFMTYRAAWQFNRKLQKSRMKDHLCMHIASVEKDDVQEVDTDVTLETNTVVKSTRAQGRLGDFDKECLGVRLGPSPIQSQVRLTSVKPVPRLAP
ncbi:hypothetical protein HYC85_020646 [Camellia sinensis]|uniref:Uncharacterized protein n=1 Tax=Camellia sinensis TaxID=4442 RepID=A0A7J7GU70_CAMSI|nr:hypothetical protein HYC85_020646 [Camellia sinensis]